MSESGVCAQSRLTLRDLIDYSPPGSSIHGILQPRILDWCAIWIDPWSALKDDFLLSEPPGKPLELVWGVGLAGGGGAEIFIGKKKIKGCE